MKGFAPKAVDSLTLLHSERPKLYRVLAVLSAAGLRLGAQLEKGKKSKQKKPPKTRVPSHESIIHIKVNIQIS